MLHLLIGLALSRRIMCIWLTVIDSTHPDFIAVDIANLRINWSFESQRIFPPLEIPNHCHLQFHSTHAHSHYVFITYLNMTEFKPQQKNIASTRAFIQNYMNREGFFSSTRQSQYCCTRHSYTCQIQKLQIPLFFFICFFIYSIFAYMTIFSTKKIVDENDFSRIY